MALHHQWKPMRNANGSEFLKHTHTHVTVQPLRTVGFADIGNCWRNIPWLSPPHYPTVKPPSFSLFQHSLNTPWPEAIARKSQIFLWRLCGWYAVGRVSDRNPQVCLRTQRWCDWETNQLCEWKKCQENANEKKKPQQKSDWTNPTPQPQWLTLDNHFAHSRKMIYYHHST